MGFAYIRLVFVTIYIEIYISDTFLEVEVKIMEEISCLYVTRACSLGLYDSLNLKPSFAAVKFNRMLQKGLTKNHIKITQLMINDSKFGSTKLINDEGIEILCGPEMNYVKKLIITIKYSFSFFKNNKNAILICDYLNYTTTIATLFMSKIFKKKSICIVTDLPDYIGGYDLRCKHALKEILYVKIGYLILKRFHYYVLLTEQMSEKIKCKRYIIVEGLYDDEYEKETTVIREKKIMYAGSLQKEYGIDSLITGFLKSKYANDFELKIFGDGDCKNEIQKICNKNNNINYYGVASNRTILKEEKESYLLVNPRPSNKEYCKYSFPSKNIEYMASGTPLLTSLLPGMPFEHQKYVYIIKNESSTGIAEGINRVLEKNETEINEFGSKARDYILKNKNSQIQAKKILELILQ